MDRCNLQDPTSPAIEIVKRYAVILGKYEYNYMIEAQTFYAKCSNFLKPFIMIGQSHVLLKVTFAKIL